MQIKNIFFFIQYILFLYRYDFTFGKPMFGPDVIDANPNEFPFIVSLSNTGNTNNDVRTNHFCTGSLITRQDVLTAAHCVGDTLEENIQVLVGSTNLNNGTGYDVLWWITYEEWADFLGKRLEFRVNDIANLRLLLAVPDHINLGVLSHIHTEDLYGDEVVIAAWGRNEQHIVPVNLRTVKLKVLSLKTCRATARKLAGKVIKVHSRHICTQANPHAVMYWGDSGGPVLHRRLIAAIHKSTMPFVNEPLNNKKLNVHTTINYYRDFIVYVINPDFNWCDI